MRNFGNAGLVVCVLSAICQAQMLEIHVTNANSMEYGITSSCLFQNELRPCVCPSISGTWFSAPGANGNFGEDPVEVNQTQYGLGCALQQPYGVFSTEVGIGTDGTLGITQYLSDGPPLTILQHCFLCEAAPENTPMPHFDQFGYCGGPYLTLGGIRYAFQSFEWEMETDNSFYLRGWLLADWDKNGRADVPDLFSFLSSWFAQDPRADASCNRVINVPDIFMFISEWMKVQ